MTRHLLTTLIALGPVPQAEIGRQLGVSGASIVQLVDDLEARGLVERKRLETDRRTQVIHLLPEAISVRERAYQLATANLEERLGTLNAGQTKELVALLQRFVTG